MLNDLDLRYIHMHTFLINDVAYMLDMVHAKGSFL